MKVVGWRERERLALELARSNVWAAGAASNGARVASQALSFGGGGGSVGLDSAWRVRYERADVTVASTELAELKRRQVERARANGERSDGAVRVQAWRSSLSAERREEHRQLCIALKRAQRARDKLDPQKMEAERERQRRYRLEHADERNAARREKRAAARASLVTGSEN